MIYLSPKEIANWIVTDLMSFVDERQKKEEDKGALAVCGPQSRARAYRRSRKASRSGDDKQGHCEADSWSNSENRRDAF